MATYSPAFSASLVGLLALSTPALAQDPQSASPTPQIIERAQDSATYGTIRSFLDEQGTTVLTTNRSFTLLESALHYFEDGQWKLSEDLIEPFPDGAIARRGPHKAIFSPDLNSAA